MRQTSRRTGAGAAGRARRARRRRRAAGRGRGRGRAARARGTGRGTRLASAAAAAATSWRTCRPIGRPAACLCPCGTLSAITLHFQLLRRRSKSFSCRVKI